MIHIKKGLDLPINGVPTDKISDHTPSHVALIGYDYIGMRPTMQVKEGDVVKKGQPLFLDKKRDGVVHTAPAAGRIVAINRGERRVFESIVIEKSGNDELTFAHYQSEELAELSADTVREILVKSGEWTAFRTRPFSRTPATDSTPSAIFVTAIDTNPLALDPMVVLKDEMASFNDGLSVLSVLSPTTYICHHLKDSLEEQPSDKARHDTHSKIGRLHEKHTIERVARLAPTNQTTYHSFGGVHPAGLAGTHIHFLHPLARGVTVWTINYQDVIAIGKLFTTGKIYTDRVISLGGPSVKDPRIIRTQRGADLADLTHNELYDGIHRVISGSVLSGRAYAPTLAHLGRFHQQVSVLPEGYERPALHFFALGRNRFSALPIYVSQFFKNKRYNFTTSTNGSPRAMVPIGAFEKVMPQDYLPTQLLRALIVEDIVSAVELGALELDEEDLALCTFVSPGKYEFGDILRDNLTRIEMEG